MQSEKKWPYGIFIFYVVFVLALLFFWYFSSQNNIELVADNYYEQELAYETRINKIRNANQLSAKPRFSIIKQPYSLVIQLAEELPAETLRGRIKFFRPSEAELDRSVPLDCDSTNRQIIGLQGIKPGKWRIQLEWSDGQEEYYHEEVRIF